MANIQIIAERIRARHIDFITRIIASERHPQSLEAAVALLASRFVTNRFEDRYTDPMGDATGLWLRITGNDDEGVSRARFDRELHAMIRTNPLMALLSLLYADAEDAIDWYVWLDGEAIEREAIPLANALSALGYKPTREERQALGGLYTRERAPQTGNC
ncbi:MULTISPECIES: hypothetical protein [Bifidobacterium]|uniref:ParB-like protein n=2 Tax=Bifidobacterium TaxID=1678 RepID=A0A087DMX2_9BIFI|nr:MULTISPECIES: hypothetical protein [Bifidobacterium]KFI96872.1 ParB-like protein [Bifidobacterium stellenboschense]NEG89121.1 hypothetical protein [Bifidobacterium aerophilum]